MRISDWSSDVCSSDLFAAGHGDEITAADRPLEQQDHAGHEVADDILQTEADAHRQRASDDRELAEIDTGKRDAGDRSDHERRVAEQCRRRFARAWLAIRCYQPQTRSASCRERVWQSVKITGAPESLKQETKSTQIN